MFRPPCDPQSPGASVETAGERKLDEERPKARKKT